MRIHICIFLLLFGSIKNAAQLIPKSELLLDLNFLNEAITLGHPTNYNPSRKIDLQSVIQEAQSNSLDSLTPLQYTLWVEKAIYKIGCVHTAVVENPLLEYTKQFEYFPYKLEITGDSLMLVDYSNGQKKQSIKGIENLSSKEIIQAFSYYKASDGASNAFSKTYFYHLSPKLIPLLLGNPTEYNIYFTKDTTVIKSKKAVSPIFDTTIPDDASGFNNSNFLIEKNNRVLLRVRSFSKSDRKFFRDVFQKISNASADTLVLDLRENLGGNRKSAALLTSFLVDSSFSYSILQPKLKPFKYLSAQGKLFYFLSKIKYNVFGIFHRKGNPLGKEFKYSYKPSKVNHFEGKIVVLVDGFSASSSAMVTSWLKQFSNATFIGSQMAGGYNGNNGGAFPNILLPQSKIKIYFPVYRVILDSKSSMHEGIVPAISLPENYLESHYDILLRNR